MTGAQYQLTGRIEVALPPPEAFRLFTPRGEQDWVEGWQPRFPSSVEDDTLPGTVFETHGPTTWLVIDCQPGRRISYARFTPGVRVGTVTVVVSDASGSSSVDVTYELTALTSEAESDLRKFASDYPAFLQSWEDKIAAFLSAVEV